MVVEQVATFDWNLLITALSGLGGVAVGGFVTWKIQERQLKHIDENRYQEQRLDTYVQFTTASNMILNYKLDGNLQKQADCTIKMIESLQKIQVISTKDVRAKAVDVIAITNFYVNEKKGSCEPEDDFKNTVSNFWQAVRIELKIENNS